MFIIDKEVKSPSIIISACEANDIMIREVLAGIEEESIPYEIRNCNIEDKDLLERCYNASQESRLGVGIVIKKTRIIVQYNKLKENNPLVNEELNFYEKEKARIIGSNAARLYKKEPFKELSDEMDDGMVEEIKNRVLDILKANLK